MSDFERAVAELHARGPGRMVPDLERITQLLGLLGDPQQAYPSVHVTGTNGKGSVVRMVGALCSAAGLSAGTYTSPHLQTVRERLSFAGRPIAAERFAGIHDEVAALADLVDQALQARDGSDADQVTYFELLTAMALWWFADVPVDVAVVEVGMGGRWDATNLVRSDVAVLGEVDVDHPQLGSTPAEVAAEKVGIIKDGSHVVAAAQQPEVQRVLEDAVAEHDATLWQVGDHLEVVDRRVAVGGQQIALRVGERTVDDILLPVYGAHQARNAALALGAFAALTGDSFAAMEDDVIRHGLGAVQVPGRLEVVHREPTVLLDGAHNPHGARAAAAALAESFEFRDLVLVVACLADKDIVGLLAELRGVVAHVVVTTTDGPRAASLDDMTAAAQQVWQGTGVAVEAAEELTAALELAEGIVGEGDGILVAGSLITVGAARDRYLPIRDDEDDDVVISPDDERVGADDQFDEGDLEELEALLEDETAFQHALEQLLDDDPDDDRD